MERLTYILVEKLGTTGWGAVEYCGTEQQAIDLLMEKYAEEYAKNEARVKIEIFIK